MPESKALAPADCFRGQLSNLTEMADTAKCPRRRTMIGPAASRELPAAEPKDHRDDFFWVAWRQYLRASPSRLKTTARKPVIEAAFPQAGRGNQREVLRSFFDLSGMCMARLDSNMRLIETNADFSHQFRRLPAELCGTHFCDLLHKDFQTRVSEQFTRMLAQQHPRFTEPMIAFRQKDSTIFDGELTAFTLRSHGGSIDSLAAVVCPDDRSRNGRPPASRKLLLTDLDVRILEGVAAGMSTVSLASKLYLSRGGVEYHVDILFRKLKVYNRPALIAKAYSMGVLCPGWPPRVHPDYLKEPMVPAPG